MTAGPRRSGTPTLDDVARLAGVSRATASRVLTSSVTVADEKRLAVEDAVAKLGYVPNTMARALATRTVGVVAVLVPETSERVFSDPFFSQLYRGAIEAFADASTRVVLTMSQPGESPDDLAGFLASGHIDGAIAASVHGREIAQRLLVAGRPVVFIGDPGVPGAPYVDMDQEGAVNLIADHLLARGAKRIATITGPLDMMAGVRRRNALRVRLGAAGQRVVAEAEGDFSMAGGEAAAERLLATGAEFDALVCASDLTAVGALRALHRAGLRVPQDLLLTGFDDIPLAAHTSPSLTTATNPSAQMANRAGRMLRALLDGREFDSPQLLQSSLVVRDSA